MVDYPRNQKSRNSICLFGLYCLVALVVFSIVSQRGFFFFCFPHHNTIEAKMVSQIEKTLNTLKNGGLCVPPFSELKSDKSIRLRIALAEEALEIIAGESWGPLARVVNKYTILTNGRPSGKYTTHRQGGCLFIYNKSLHIAVAIFRTSPMLLHLANSRCAGGPCLFADGLQGQERQ